MMSKYYKNIRYIILTLCLLPCMARGQELVHVMGDTTVCLSDSVVIGMGFRGDHEVVVRNVETELSYGDSAFLPDGVDCGEMGCRYRSAVTFDCFAPGATIGSVNDIRYIRLKMEHSFLGDLYINVTCPNGQKADILRFSNYSGTAIYSNCLSTLPASARGWNGPAYLNEDHAMLGVANTNDNQATPCEHNDYTNAPGTGWNYCWSDNTTKGYSYASNGGYVYRSDNQQYAYTTGTSATYRVDSSDVAAGSQFYHPDESFGNLVGCPLNGEWYIEVIDGVRQDNGYIFDWELALDEAFAGSNGSVAGYGLSGDSVRRVDDSTFVVYAPQGAVGDTVVEYHVSVYGTGGERVDTVLRVHYVPQLYRLVSGHYCAGDTLLVDELSITTTTHRIDTVLLPGIPCPITREIDVTFGASYEQYDTVGICNNQAYTYNGVDYGGPGDYEVHLMTTEDCDSNIHLTLYTVDAEFSVDPYISADGELWKKDTLLAGCAPYTVFLKDSSVAVSSRRWHTGDTGWFASEQLAHTYDSAGVYSITLAATSENGCRDTAVLRRAVYVYERPEAGFRWEMENPVMSHPTVMLYADEGEGLTDYTWAVQKANGGGSDTLFGQEVGYTWSMEGGNVFGDFPVTLIEVRHHRGPYGGPLDCYDTLEQTVTIVNDWLQFPNLVSPNGDGLNDKWEVVNLLECGAYSMNELWIYSAWGTLVYHAENITKKEDFWDPEATGSPDGTYYFRFMARSLYGIVKRNGSIEVVR